MDDGATATVPVAIAPSVKPIKAGSAPSLSPIKAKPIINAPESVTMTICPGVHTILTTSETGATAIVLPAIVPVSCLRYRHCCIMLLPGLYRAD